MLESVEWGEYRLGNLFGEATRGKRLKRADRVQGDLPFVTAGEADTGVSAFIGNKVDVFAANTITIDMFGSAKYRDYQYGADDHVAVVHTENLPKHAVCFIASAIHKVANAGEFHYGRNFYAKDAKNLMVSLPSSRTGEPDYEFMEKFIAELKALRIAELKAYLFVTELKDYTLTPEEEQAVKDFEAGNVEWGKYHFEKVFNHIKQGRRLKKDDQKEGAIPFVMAGTSNTGVINYISNPIATFPPNSITIDIFGNTFYRNYGFGAGDDTGVYWDDQKNYSKEIMLFFTTAMSRALVGKYSFGKKLRSSQSLKEQMFLLEHQGSPDYSGMKTFISAIQKLVIKDVVLYADREIEATKQVVNKTSIIEI